MAPYRTSSPSIGHFKLLTQDSVMPLQRSVDRAARFGPDVRGIDSSAAGRMATYAVAVALTAGCVPRAEREVVVYTALDREFSEPILTDFQTQSGITARAKYDVESTKTVGLTQAILAERNRPVCDVFWNNEIVQTLRLDSQGLLKPLPEAVMSRAVPEFRDDGGRWVGFAGRGRVLLVNTELLPDRASWPRRVADLADPVWKGRCGIARPLFGTTSTHAAILFALDGEEAATAFFRDVAANAETLTGNKQVAVAVGAGQLAWGLTDTDDAIIEIEKGFPVAIVFPDQGDGERGTLLIPNTVGWIAGGPNSAQAEALLLTIVSPDTEARLAAGPSAQIPLLSPSARSDQSTSRVVPTPSPTWMTVPWREIPAMYDRSAAVLETIFP